MNTEHIREVAEVEQRRKRAWAEGRDAYNLSTAHTSGCNPYPETQWPEHEAWSEGWHHAQRDAQEARE